MKIGSLFSGYRGLDMAAENVFGAETVWWSDIDPGAIKINQHHWPDQPNLGDITQVDWAAVEPVDILTGGFPCQDLSAAGKRAGLRPGTRSGLWTHMAYAISQLRPRCVIAENVRGLLSAAAYSNLEPCPWCVGGSEDGEPDLRALGAVLGDLASLGYDAQWVGLRAADVGAPHGRFRVFIFATDTTGQPGSIRHGDDLRTRRGTVGREPTPGRGTAADAARDAGLGGVARTDQRHLSDGDGQGARPDAAADAADHDRDRSAGTRATSGWPGSAAADAERGGWDGRSGASGQGRRLQPADSRDPPADTERGGRTGWSPDPIGGTLGRDVATRRSEVDWGDYEPAIRHWERVLGRPAPAPTETSTRGSQRLAPRFVEWMMGLPVGHVTNVPGLNRNEQLKALGNGVVPQQAEAALRLMISMEAAA